MCPETLCAEIVSLCADIHRAEFRLIELIEQLDAAKPWRHEELPSCAHWLNAHCGLDLVTAREKVRIARALPTFDLIREAFRVGELSYSKVRAITRIADCLNEAELVAMARAHTAAHVARIVATTRQAERLKESKVAFDASRSRHFTCHSDECGTLVFEGFGALRRTRAKPWGYRPTVLNRAHGDAPGTVAASTSIEANARCRRVRRVSGVADLALFKRRICGIAAVAVGVSKIELSTNGASPSVHLHSIAIVGDMRPKVGRGGERLKSPLRLEPRDQPSLVHCPARDSTPRGGSPTASRASGAVRRTPTVRTPDSWMGTTLCIGRTAARPLFRTRCCCADTTTGCCTKGVTTS